MKRVCVWLILPLLIVLAGCSSQDFGRPIARIGDVVDSGKSYVEDSRDEEGMRRATQLAEILAEWERQKATVDEDYTLGPDDVLAIGILSLEAPDEVAEVVRTISKDGTVALPLVGAVACAGLTAREFQAKVIAGYKGKYLQDPQVDVAVSEYRSAPVVVTGAVGQPGVYYLRHNRSSVLEVLSMANGLSQEAGKSLLIVRRRVAAGEAAGEGVSVDPAATNGPVETATDDTAADEGSEPDALQDLDADLITVDLEQLLDEGDVRLNLPIVGGDIVTVPPGRREYVYVLGYVQRPGAFELEGRQRVRALQAVAMAGGLSGAARAQNSFLIIDKPSGRQVVPVDLTKIARGQRPPVYMESGHTLVVGSGVFARLAEFIRPTVSAGANLTPGP